MSAKIRVFCPSCKTILEVPAGFAEKNTRFPCPQCGFNAPFNSYGRLNADIFSQGAGLGHEDSTFVSSNPTDATECFTDCKCEEGVLVRCNDRKAISLPMGLNSIGRERLNPEDLCISRRHSAIEVSRSGQRMKYVYYDTEAKNASYVNGKRLDKGMKVVLSFGDELRMGRTAFVFEKKGNE